MNSINSPLRKKEIESISNPPTEVFHNGFGERAWLKNHGKEEYISFSDKALIELRKYFNSLDQHNHGSIGVEELEDPFIAFGLSESREQVEELVKCNFSINSAVDLDGSGVIEFDEFLEIMLKIKRGRSKGSKNAAMFDFFESNLFNNIGMITGQLGEESDKDMPFRLHVSTYRRKKLLESMMGENKEKKEKGSKILQNFKKQVLNTPGLKDTLNESKKGSLFMNGIDYKSKRNGI